MLLPSFVRRSHRSGRAAGSPRSPRARSARPAPPHRRASGRRAAVPTPPTHRSCPTNPRPAPLTEDHPRTGARSRSPGLPASRRGARPSFLRFDKPRIQICEGGVVRVVSRLRRCRSWPPGGPQPNRKLAAGEHAGAGVAHPPAQPLIVGHHRVLPGLGAPSQIFHDRVVGGLTGIRKTHLNARAGQIGGLGIFARSRAPTGCCRRRRSAIGRRSRRGRRGRSSSRLSSSGWSSWMSGRMPIRYGHR